ncbi:FHA domain-containing protein [Acaryochloris sp. IP29b_bin.148]|uniref:FHA domain-containing protein n=1 Tax=Acaryochloris sp. IP29b_bin.148 TaxID=2969218 RepID=UPI0026236B33|nr:FHA domain-containing protein [Acaryochloris sp. IP29b_bin.148]
MTNAGCHRVVRLSTPIIMNVQAPTSPQLGTQECHHVLMIEEQEGVRCILLEAPTYSLGRDKKNTIVLPASKSVSRFHAMLLRIPGATSSDYNYRIVDGDATGQLSTNGVVVNGKRNTSHTLTEGDTVMLGDIKVSYRELTLPLSELDSARFDNLDIRGTLPHAANAPLSQAEGNGMAAASTTAEDELGPTMFFKKSLKISKPATS